MDRAPIDSGIANKFLLVSSSDIVYNLKLIIINDRNTNMVANIDNLESKFGWVRNDFLYFGY